MASVLVQVFGLMLAGYVVHKFKPRPEIATGYGVMVSTIQAAGFVLAIFIAGCPNVVMHGTVQEDGYD
jgi:hypothetical protein